MNENELSTSFAKPSRTSRRREHDQRPQGEHYLNHEWQPQHSRNDVQLEHDQDHRQAPRRHQKPDRVLQPTAASGCSKLVLQLEIQRIRNRLERGEREAYSFGQVHPQLARRRYLSSRSRPCLTFALTPRTELRQNVIDRVGISRAGGQVAVLQREGPRYLRFIQKHHEGKAFNRDFEPPSVQGERIIGHWPRGTSQDGQPLLRRLVQPPVGGQAPQNRASDAASTSYHRAVEVLRPGFG